MSAIQEIYNSLREISMFLYIGIFTIIGGAMVLFFTSRYFVHAIPTFSGIVLVYIAIPLVIYGWFETQKIVFAEFNKRKQSPESYRGQRKGGNL